MSATGRVTSPWAVAQTTGLRLGCSRSQRALRRGYQVQHSTAATARASPNSCSVRASACQVNSAWLTR
ncbi:hypothetical protein D3C77_595430 [compost metagenome]